MQVPVTNTGDVLVKPTGTVTLTTSDGRKVFSADIAMGSVYANLQETQLAIPLDASLAGQEYELTLHLTDEGSGVEATVGPQEVVFSGEVPQESQGQLVEPAVVQMPDARCRNTCVRGD